MTNIKADNAHYAGRDLEVTAALERYNRRIADEFRPYIQGAGIEFGAGIGTFARLLLDSFTTLDLVEPSPNLHSALEKRFEGEPKIRVIGESLERFLAQEHREAYDVAMLVNVLEHIADDEAALVSMEQTLRPGGHLLIFVPALQMLYSEFDRLVGHHRRYHLRDVTRKVRRVGLDIVTARYFDILGIVPWLLINRMMGAVSLNPTLARIYDTIGTPVGRVLESIVSPPLGKNIVLIARKPLETER